MKSWIFNSNLFLSVFIKVREGMFDIEKFSDN